MPDRVHIEGLDELRAELRRIGSVEDSKEFKNAGYRVGAELVIPEAQAAASTPLMARAAATMAAARVATGGAIRFGGGFAGAMGAEFGANQNQLRNTSRGPMLGWNQFMPHLGQVGYFFWPTIRSNQDQIVEMYDRLLDPLWARAFPDRS